MELSEEEVIGAFFEGVNEEVQQYRIGLDG